MSEKFHVGDFGPGPCSARKQKCPYGGVSGDENHYSTIQEAEKAFSEQFPKKLQGVSKGKFIPKISSFTDEDIQGLKGIIKASGVKLITDLRDGKKVSDIRVDTFLASDTARWLKYDSEEKVANLYQAIELDRMLRNTPNALPTAGSFDPETMSVFSSEDARKYDWIAKRAINRQIKHVQWLRQLAGMSRMRAREIESSKMYSTSVLNDTARYEENALYASARLKAMSKEINYCASINPDYKFNISSGFHSFIQQPSEEDITANVIVNVRKIKAVPKTPENIVSESWKILSESNDLEDKEIMSEAWESMRQHPEIAKRANGPDDFYDIGEMFDLLSEYQET